jgi:hypothetical protein
MALFNIIAKTDSINWGDLHNAIFEVDYEFISIFPIPDTLGLNCNAIGITTKVDVADIQIVKIQSELLFILQVLSRYNFTINELYEGNQILPHDFTEKMNYVFPSN